MIKIWIQIVKCNLWNVVVDIHVENSIAISTFSRSECQTKVWINVKIHGPHSRLSDWSLNQKKYIFMISAPKTNTIHWSIALFFRCDGRCSSCSSGNIRRVTRNWRIVALRAVCLHCAGDCVLHPVQVVTRKSKISVYYRGQTWWSPKW